MSDTTDSPARRVFPLPDVDLYEPGGFADTPDERAARRVIALGVRDLPRPQRLGRRLTPAGRVGRLLYLHRLGIVAEVAGQARRADFFWNEIATELAAMPADFPGWQAVIDDLKVAEPGLGVLNEPGEFRRRLCREVFLDTHRAFAGGARDDARQAQHLDRVRELFALVGVGVSDEERRGLIAPPFERQLNEAFDRQEWSRAIELAERLRLWFPVHLAYVNRQAEAMTLQALAAHRPSENDAENRYQAEMLRGHIAKLEQLRQEVPFAVAAFDGLGHLYRMRAVKLANGDRPAQALVAIEYALTYKPDWVEAREARGKIEDLLRQLQSRMRQVSSQLGTFSAGYNTTRTVSLSDEGRAMRAEANAGTDPRDHYCKTSHREQVHSHLRHAKALALWLRIGLPVPTEDWAGQAAALDEGTDLLVARKPRSLPDLTLGWLQVTDERPDLRLDRFDPAKVVAFFVRANDEPPPLQEVDPMPAMPAAPHAVGEPSPPADFWWLTARDWPAKAFVVVGLVVLGLAITLGVVEARRSTGRNEAFADVLAATRAEDGPAIVAASDRFETSAGLAGDSRLAVVRRMRDNADDLDFRRRRREAFDELRAAALRDDDPAMLLAAERFDAITPPRSDFRSEQVAELRTRAADAPDRRKRDEAYRDMLAAAGKEDAEGIMAAAKVFRALRGSNGDPRSRQVSEVQAQAAEIPARKQRDAAYKDVKEAVSRADFPAVTLAGKTFLDVRPTGGDPRASQVRDALEWAAEGPNRQKRDAAWTAALAATEKRDGAAVARAVADFRAAPPGKGEDGRLGEVGELADEAAEWPNRAKRTAAYEQMVKAFEARDAEGVAKAAVEFGASPILKIADPRSAQVRELTAEAAEWPNRAKRSDAYARLVKAFRERDTEGVKRAATIFDSAKPIRKADGRAEQVRELLAEAVEWPNRAKRDAAYAKFRADGVTDEAVMSAAVEFLQAVPVAQADGRTGEVRLGYEAAFVRWFAELADLDERAKQRIETFRELSGKG